LSRQPRSQGPRRGCGYRTCKIKTEPRCYWRGSRLPRA
jgi:hypothetical protein